MEVRGGSCWFACTSSRRARNDSTLTWRRVGGRGNIQRGEGQRERGKGRKRE